MKRNGKIERSANGLRSALFDQLDGLQAKKITANDAKAFSNVAQTIIKSVEVQIKYETMRLAGDLPPGLAEMKLVGDASRAS